MSVWAVTSAVRAWIAATTSEFVGCVSVDAGTTKRFGEAFAAATALVSCADVNSAALPAGIFSCSVYA